MANEFKVRKGLIVQGSGSTILDILGSQGELFSVTDSLVGSLFSVNDISGIPIMEVFSDNTIKMGTFNQEAIIVSGSRTGMGTALPQAELHISGANNDSLFRIQSPASASIMFVSGSGLVGIGTLTPTQKISVGDGNVGFTSGFGISWDSDTEWVKRAAASDQLQFATGNTVRLNIGSTQGQLVAIGLGTTAASAQFQVRGGGATAATTAMRIEDSGGNARLTILDDGTSAFNTSHLYVSSSGNVGIGLTSPLARLHISGANALRMQNTGFDTFEWFFSAGTGIGFRNVTDGTTPFFVGGTDDIGIGTTNTSARLHVSGASNSNLLRVGSPAQANILFITGSGNIGIGTATPVHNLVVDGNTGVSINAGGATFPNIHRDSTDGGMLLRSWNGSTFTNNVKITPTTEVGIGTTTPTAELHISGASNSNLLQVGSPSNANILFVTGSGRVGINTTSSVSLFDNNISTFTIFQNSGSGDGLTPSVGLQVVNSGSSANAQANISIVTMGDKFASLSIGTSGSSTINNYWQFSKRNAASSHAFQLYNNSNGTFSNPLFSFVKSGNSILGENNQIQIDDANGRVGLQVTPSDFIHLYSEPGGGNYLRIDATSIQAPPLTTLTPDTGYGITTNKYYLAEPDYWMEISLDGTIVLIPCYVPA